MSLVEHAKRELNLAGLDRPDADYDGMIAASVLALMELFASQGHSGYSARLTLDVFNRLASFKPLTPVTNDPDEWMDVCDKTPDHEACWQNKRHSSCFSNDGGKTYYDIDAGDGRAVHMAAPR